MMPVRPIDCPHATSNRHASRSTRLFPSARGVRWLIVLTLAAAGCADNTPSWADRNRKVIDEHKVTGRTRELPPLTVPTVLGDGEPLERAKLPMITIGPGVRATVGWSRGALVERLEMDANAAYPRQVLNEELFIIVQEGSATIDIDGRTAELKKAQAIYLQPGAARSMTAGANGLRAFEVYSPVRLDHLARAGQNTDGVSVTFPDQGVTPSLQPGTVIDVNDIQLTPLTDPVAGRTYRRSTTHARLLWGRNAQISLVSIDPQSEIALHIHPEDQLTTTVRGTIEQGVVYVFRGDHMARHS